MSSWIKNVDFKNISPDNPCGFEGFQTTEELEKNKCAIVPEQMGIYLVLVPGSEQPTFGIWPQRPGESRNTPLPVPELVGRWIPGARVIYIGKAGGGNLRSTLRSRLRQYINGRGGVKSGHDGGRHIWQITDDGNLLFAWRPLVKDDPSQCERELLQKFIIDYNGQCPFANGRGCGVIRERLAREGRLPAKWELSPRLKDDKLVISTDAAPRLKFPQAIRKSNILIVSGQVGTPLRNSLRAWDVTEEMRQALANVETIVKAAGGSKEDICKVTIYLTHIRDLEKINAVYYEFFSQSQPARTAVAVSALEGNAQVEVEAVAILD